ncbi:SPRY-domain-containing protein [Backusella circina FSU 941]|nr:SPRY-domain-containing protein [Backusella circina FSU 941]
MTSLFSPVSVNLSSTGPAKDTTYSSAFPPLQGAPWASLPKMNAHTQNLYPSLTPSKYPSYLENTSYANLVAEQCQTLKGRNKFGNNNYTCPSEEPEQVDLRLPYFWNRNDKAKAIQVGMNGYDLTFTGVERCKKELEAASIRSNFSIKPQCGVYYYEIQVNSKGTDGYIAIGLCTASSALNHLPGYDAHSFAYHADSGNILNGNSQSKQCGPTFSSGDTVGCGINFSEKTIFFTKNGVSLGSAFSLVDVSEPLYPSVGLRTLGEDITANFGQKPFLFDIDHYIKEQQKLERKTISSVNQKSDLTLKNNVDQLVLSYLIHQGYIGAAKSLENNIAYTKPPLEKNQKSPDTNNDDDLHRGTIRTALMSGDVDSAIKKVDAFYPRLFENNEGLLFKLKCQKFIEYLAEANNSTVNSTKTTAKRSSLTSSHSANSDHSDAEDDVGSICSGRSRTLSMNSDLHNQVLYEEDEDEDHPIHTEPVQTKSFASVLAHNSEGNYSPPIASPLPVSAPGRRLSWAAIAATPSSTTSTLSNGSFSPGSSLSSTSDFLDDDAHGNTKRRHSSFVGVPRRNSSSSVSGASTFSVDSEEDNDNPKRMELVRQAMQYSHQLQEEYTKEEYRTKLMELFSQFAYSDSSYFQNVAHLSSRDSLASEVNAAIQGYQKKPKVSPLEVLFRQSVTTSKELTLSGHSKASLLHIEGQFKSSPHNNN